MKHYQLLVIFLGTICLNAQNSTTIYVGGGFAGQENEINSTTGGGITFGIFTPFLAKPAFSFGLNSSGEYFFSDKDDYKLDFSAFDLYDATYSTSLDGFSRQGHRLFNIGIGPQFNLNLGERLTISPIVLFGYSYFTQNQFTVVENVEYMGAGLPVNFTKEIFHQEESEAGGFFWSPRVRFAYALSGHFSLWAEADMNFYESKEMQRRLVPFGEPNQEGQYNWGQLLEGSYETSEASTSHTQWGVNIGLAYHFGKRKKKTTDNPNEETSFETDCRKTKISEKNNNRTYFVKKEEFPVFEWENKDENVTDYEVKIYKTNKPIFEKDSGNWIRTNKPIFEKDSPVYVVKTKNKSLKTDKKLQKIFESIPQNTAQTYAWTLTTYYKDCPPQTAGPGTVKMSKNNIGIDVTEIECDGYTADGKTKYIIKYNLAAMPGNSNNWMVNSISTVNNNTGGTIQTYPFSPVQNLPANTIQSYTLNIEVPVGLQNITLQANGTLGAGAGSVSSDIELPNCVCSTCDDWQINSRNETLTRVTPLPAANFATLFLSGMIQVQNADPMQSVKAEIVSVQNTTADPACKGSSCAIQSSQMGLISNWSGTGLGPNNAVWTRTLTDNDNDGYANGIAWNANASTGVSLSNYVPVRLYINIPISSLDCCESAVHICVRYTFTDINCNTCDYLVCYDYTPPKDDGNGGNSGDPHDPPTPVNYDTPK